MLYLKDTNGSDDAVRERAVGDYTKTMPLPPNVLLLSFPVYKYHPSPTLPLFPPHPRPQLFSPKRTKMHFMECPALSVQKSTQRTYVSGALSVQEFHEGLSYVLALSQSAAEKDVT
jgi:hypothetical protein